MLLATQGVECSFNNQMSKQLDGVAMGSPLGPALGNMLKTFMKVDGSIIPGVYFHYVDDTSVIFVELECDCFHVNLNQLHPALSCMVEKEQNNSVRPSSSEKKQRNVKKFERNMSQACTMTFHREFERKNFSAKKVHLSSTFSHFACELLSQTNQNSYLFGKLPHFNFMM